MHLQHQKADGYFIFSGFVGFISVLHESLNCICIVGCSGWHVGDPESQICGAELPFHQWKPVWGLASWVCRAGSYWKREDSTRSKATNKKQRSSAVSPEKSQGISCLAQHCSGQHSKEHCFLWLLSLQCNGGEWLAHSKGEGLKYVQKTKPSFSVDQNSTSFGEKLLLLLTSEHIDV